MCYSISNSRYSYSQKRDQALKNSICKGIKWTAVESDLNTLAEYINEGFAYTHVFQDDKRLKDNFIYSSIVSIDIDDCSITMELALESIDKKPTFCHYTASNGYKGNGYRYRFIYVFEDLITKEHYTPLVCSISEYLKCNIEGFNNSDDCSKVLNQFYFGNDKKETAMTRTNLTYHLSDFPHEIEVYGSNSGVATSKKGVLAAQASMPNTQFFSDLKSMEALDFLAKYRESYVVQDHSTPIKYKYGADIFDKSKYEEIYRPWMLYEAADEKKHSKIKVYKDGDNRRKHLYADAIMFRRIKPTITIEELVFSLMNEIYSIGKYDNSDNQLDVFGIASSVLSIQMERIEEFEYKGKKKGFKVDKKFCDEIGVKPNSYTNTVRKLINMDKVIPLYNNDLTYKQNIENMKAQGIKISEKTLRRYIEYDYQKELREDAENAQLAKAYIKYFLQADNENKRYNNTTTINLQCLKTEKKKRKGSITDEELKDMYDITLSLKENLIIMNDSGVKVGKDRLYEYCRKHGIETNPKKSKSRNKSSN